MNKNNNPNNNHNNDNNQNKKGKNKNSNKTSLVGCDTIEINLVFFSIKTADPPHPNLCEIKRDPHLIIG